MKKLIFTISVFALFITVNAQQKVALQSNGTTTIFSSSSPFVDAYTAAVSGDTIYLPGGNIPFPATIDKGLTIFGAGHYPSATLATNNTVLNGNIAINGNADNLHLEGIEFTGSITFNTNIKADNVVIKRCKVLHITYNGTGTTPCKNNTISENVILGNITLTNAYSCLVSNNIINATIINGSNIGISNNILLFNDWGYLFNNVDNSNISNNIIFQKAEASYVTPYCDLSTFSYNIFALTPTIGNNTFEANNWYGIVMSTVFVNQTGNGFDYTHDYHLASPTTYVDAVGTQIGIYGGIFPYKAESIPTNPHIKTKSISTQTNSIGEISVNISVEAQ